MTATQALPLQPASEDIWDKKYRLKDKNGVPVDETVEDTWVRVARAVSGVEATPELRERWYERFLWALRRGAIPAGRITSNAGAQEHKPATSLINCLGGDTPVLTDRGVKPIRSLVGAPVRVLNALGKWAEVEFRSFGLQTTYPLAFRHGSRRKSHAETIWATAGHRWILEGGRVITSEYWLTGDANKGHNRLPNIQAPRPSRENDDYARGVFHGLMVGDGHAVTEEQDRYVMDLVGAKAALAPWVERQLDKKGLDTTYNAAGSSGLRWNFCSDVQWKELPDSSASLSYIRGFAAGVLATDGSVTRREGGRASTCIDVFGSEDLMNYLKTWLPAVGVVPQSCSLLFPKGARTAFGERQKDVWRLSINPATWDAEDVLRPEHRASFAPGNRGQKMASRWTFEGVTGAGRREEVFCCEERQTGAFSLGVGLLTGNCTVSGSIHDNMDDIMRKAHEAALTLKAGCGIGYAFSTLRPRGAYVAGAGSYTSGPLSFMDIYDATCFTVASAGGRRGAQMGTFDVSHPDVREFIRAKREDGRLRQFNLSLLITDEFVEAVKADGDWSLVFPVHPKEQDGVDFNDPAQVVWREWEITDRYIVRDDGLVACKVYKTVKARHLWDAIMASTYDFAEPGFILIDRVNEMNNNWWCENIRATNPCVTGDTLVLTRTGEVAIRDVAGTSVEVWNGFEWSSVVPRVTGVNQPVVRLTFDNGASLVCTPYHGFFRGDGQKVEARQLRVGDGLLPFLLPGDAEYHHRTVTAIESLPGVVPEVFCFTELKRHSGVFNGVLTANCGEQPLPPYGSCWTGSMRLNTNHGLIRTDHAFALVQQGKPLQIAVDAEFTGGNTSLRPCTLVQNGNKEVFEVAFANGQRIELTADHRVYTPEGWQRVDELSVGSQVHVQAREMETLDLVSPFDLGMLKYLLDRHEGEDLVVFHARRKAVLIPLLDRLLIDHRSHKQGIAVSRAHPVVREIERCDIHTADPAVLQGYAYAAYCSAASYRGKPCVYAEEGQAVLLARILEQVHGHSVAVTHHAHGRYRVRVPAAAAPPLSRSASPQLDLDYALYGWLLADRWLTDSMGVLFSDTDDEAQRLLAPRFQELTGTKGSLRTAYRGQNVDVQSLACYRKEAVEQFRADLSLADYTSKQVRVPEKVFQATLDQQASFLAAVFCADGGVGAKRPAVSLTSASQGFLQDVQMLLLNFGIHGSIHSGVSKTHTFYTLNVRHRDAYRYFRYIGFPFCSNKQRRLEEGLANKSRWRDMGDRSVETVVSVTAKGVQPVYDIEEFSTHTLIVNGVVVHNCLLGSLNLTSFVRDPFSPEASFDFREFREAVRVFTRMLDNVVELNGLPLEQQQHEIAHKRRHGMGFLGLGSALTMLRLPYGSPESIEFTEEVSREMAVVGWEMALELAQEKGPAPIMLEEFEVTADMLRKRPEMTRDGYRLGDRVPGRILHARYSRYMQRLHGVAPDVVMQLAEVGARFTHHSSIAPTGTISLSLANNASNGIEPSFAHHYSRNVIREGRKAKEKVEVYSYELLAYRAWVNPEALPFTNDPAKQLPDYFTVADQVTPEQHVDIQAASQKWIDSSISKTANVPQDFPYERFKGIYLYAHSKGLKGCTTFRFNPAAFQGVLVKEEDLANTTYRFTLEDGSTVEFKGNEEVEYEGEVNTAANLFDALKEGYYGKF